MESIAKNQKMNTDVRKSVFMVMMSSEDYVDAFNKLTKLELKNKQDREIVRVLISCCIQEKAYNKFYELLASRLCKFSKNFIYSFQYTFWDHIKILDKYPIRYSHTHNAQKNKQSCQTILLLSWRIDIAFISIESHWFCQDYSIPKCNTQDHIWDNL